jgi:hypothetical protein
MPEEAGETLIGTVTDVDSAWSKFRANAHKDDPDAGWYPLITLSGATINGETVGDGAVKVHAFRTVLYNEVLRKQPQAGETVEITFVGEGRAADGMNAPHIYRVKVHGRAGSPAAYAGFRRPAGPTAQTPAATDAPVAEPQSDDDIPF